MSYNWGPRYIVPSKALKSYSGIVQLREEFDENMLRMELEALTFRGPVVWETSPCHTRHKNTETWIKNGEAEDRSANCPVRWDTSQLENGQYEVMGLMHVFVKEDSEEKAIARQNVVEITVKN